jgi:hypothetical protein
VFEHVSLSFNKKRQLIVCKRYGNNNVRMVPKSYMICGVMLGVFNASAYGFIRKFQEHVNQNTGY